MEQKINEEISKIILCVVSTLEKHLQSNQYQDLFFKIRHIRTKYVYFLFRFNFDFGFFIKHEQFHKKEWIYIAVSETVSLLNSPLSERSNDRSNKDTSALRGIARFGT